MANNVKKRSVQLVVISTVVAVNVIFGSFLLYYYRYCDAANDNICYVPKADPNDPANDPNYIPPRADPNDPAN